MSTIIDIERLLTWAFRDQAVEASSRADPDAVTIYWAVRALPAHHSNAVIRHARTGTRPNWQITASKVVSLDGVRQSRQRYVDWVRAMVVLQRSLDGALSSFRVTGPATDEEPWVRQRIRA